MAAIRTPSFETDAEFGLRGFSGTTGSARGGANRRRSFETSIEIVSGDITLETADAIVNPVGPGLVDLAIRRAAGRELLEAFHRRADELPNGRLLPGQAIATPGFRLPATHVIHCGPPVFPDDPVRARQDLVACHLEALKLARDAGWASVAFPAIGTGIYRYPANEAAATAVETVITDLRRHGAPRHVRIVLATAKMLRIYLAAAAAATDGEFELIERGAVFAGPQRHS